MKYELNIPYANNDGLWIATEIRKEGISCYVLLLQSEDGNNKLVASCMSQRGILNRMYDFIK